MRVEQETLSAGTVNIPVDNDKELDKAASSVTLYLGDSREPVLRAKVNRTSANRATKQARIRGRSQTARWFQANTVRGDTVLLTVEPPAAVWIRKSGK